jgi:uncharacterized protein (UPF0332 family)
MQPHSRDEMIQYRLQRSKETISEAKSALENNHLHLAANRIYYAIFYSVSALSLAEDFSTGKHKQLFGWFTRTYIKTQLVPVAFGKIYASAYETRQEGDYDDMVDFDKDSLVALFSDMETFVNEIAKLINSSSVGEDRDK